MQVATILGPGASLKQLKPFQVSGPIWTYDQPGNSCAAEALIIFGGDGTIHRNLARLVQLQLPVLVVPCGSGNDCARALGLRSLRDSLAAWRRFSAGGGNVRTIDLGVITPLGKSEAIADSAPRRRHYFCCVGGVGLDSEIARRANRLPRWLRANGGYALSFLPSLLKFVPFPMTILASPSQAPGPLTARSAKPAILAAFANAPAYGGGMKIAPQAQMDDGRLDVCVIENMDKLKLFCLFPTVYFGRHLRFAEVESFQTGHLQLVTEMPLAVYADGEYVCQTPVEVTVAPKTLRVIVPA